MDAKKLDIISKVHMLLLLALIVVNFVVIINGITASDLDTIHAVITVLRLFTMAAGLYYIGLGYMKDASSFYKLYLALYALSNLTILVMLIMRNAGPIAIAFKVIVTVMSLVLVFVKDLGKQVTWVLYALLLGSELIVMLPFFGIGMTTASLKDKLSDLVMAGTVGLMINGKYIDKDARGAK